MPFVKQQKNKAYYKRIQTKFRRRREGKTDYQQRRALVVQAKNKYNSPKYRLVCRRTNTRVIMQVVYATIRGDRVLCQADSRELKKYGMADMEEGSGRAKPASSGYTSYPACYATGLLIARRTLQLVGLDQAITGVEECDAEEYCVAEQFEQGEAGERRPFKVILDVGLTRTIPGSRVFACLKGAVDGGLHVPHSPGKFPGYGEPEERGQPHTYDAAAHLERILGAHVSEYMADLREEDPDRYQAQFKTFIQAGVEEDIEDFWKGVHEKIRESPKFEKKAAAGITNTRKGNIIVTSNGTEYVRKVKKSKAERRGRVAQKMQAAAAKLMAGDEDEE